MTPTTAPTNPTHAEDERIQSAIAGVPGAFHSLLGQLSSDNPWLQEMMSDAIYDCGEPALWYGLLTGLALKGWDIAGSPQEALAPEAARRLEDAVLRLFTVDKADSPSTAAKLDAAADALDAADRRVRALAAVVLARRGEARGLAALRDAALNGAPDERRRAVQVLGKLDDERAAWTLAQVLAADDEALQLDAVQALGELGELAVPALLSAAEHTHEHVRWHAIRALGAVADPGTAPALARALADPAHRVRWAAAEALINLGLPAVPAILDSLTRPMRVNDSLAAARYALHRIGPRALQDWLQPLLDALSGSAAPVEAPGVAFRLLREWQAHPINSSAQTT